MCRIWQYLTPPQGIKLVNSMIDGTEAQEKLVKFKKRNSHTPAAGSVICFIYSLAASTIILMLLFASEIFIYNVIIIFINCVNYDLCTTLLVTQYIIY